MHVGAKRLPSHRKPREIGNGCELYGAGRGYRSRWMTQRQMMQQPARAMTLSSPPPAPRSQALSRSGSFSIGSHRARVAWQKSPRSPGSGCAVVSINGSYEVCHQGEAGVGMMDLDWLALPQSRTCLASDIGALVPCRCRSQTAFDGRPLRCGHAPARCRYILQSVGGRSQVSAAFQTKHALAAAVRRGWVELRGENCAAGLLVSRTPFAGRPYTSCFNALRDSENNVSQTSG